MKLVVIDTNVFVSSVLGGFLRPILDHWRDERFELVVSEAIVREYITVLRRQKFELPLSVIDPIMTYLLRKARFVTPEEHITTIKEDFTDNMFLEAAVTGSADAIVSGDKQHILPLETFRGIPIITAYQFLKWFDQDNTN